MPRVEHSPPGAVPVEIPGSPSNNQPSVSETGSGSFHGFEWRSSVDETTKKQLTGLFRQRSQVEQKVVRIQFTLRDQKQLSLAQLNVISSKLAAAYTEFSGFHSTIMALIPDEAEDEQDEIYAAFEDRHDRTSTAVEEMVLSAKRNVPQPTAAPQFIIQQQPLRVPIPTFDGSYASWPKFKAIFQDLMATSGDADAIKLYHLDKALVGAAAGALDAKVMSEGNYQLAWNVLTERYENIRVIVESHIKGLLTLKKMSGESFKELRCLMDEATGHVESLRYLEQEVTGISEHMIVYLITAALDKSTRKAWESTQKRGTLPKYDQTVSFLKSRCQILEHCESSQIVTPQTVKPKSAPPSFKPPMQKSYTATTTSSSTVNSCHFCGGEHLNYQCTALKQLSTAQKIEKVRSSGVCFNCLRKGHQSKHCTSNKTCRKCNKRHHTLLHEGEDVNRSQDVQDASNPKKPDPPTTALPVAPVVDQPVSTTCSCSHVRASKTVLLLTAVVHAIDKQGQPHPCRVLLDNGSQVNFVTEEMANLLGIPKTRANVPITGINALRSLARDKVFVKFRSRHSDFYANIECLVTPKVTGTIPTSKIDISNWNIPDGIMLADPEFHNPDKVDMLVGGELFFDLLKPGQLHLAENLPQLRDTYLGWVVAGVLNVPYVSDVAIQHANLASVGEVEELMHQFWQLEEVPNVSPLSSEEQFCEAHFVSNYKRDQSVRFVVRLPFNENVGQLDNCRPLALKRFLMLENRLARNPQLQAQYVAFIREYEALKHCHEVNEVVDPPNNGMYFLPHHAVLTPTSSSTKCRVVFDASAKSSSSKLSLNDVLQVGPVVQSDLYSIMLRFRRHAVAFSADISKMYRQVLVAPEDRPYQRIFWRENPSKPLRVLELDTVTYGTASAPYQATRCLVQLADDESADFPIASKILKEDFYVDDVLSGADTVEEALESQRQLQAILARGCFPLHKWCSNSKEFLQHLPTDVREKQLSLREYGPNEAIKVLGLLWDPNIDTFLIANPPRLPSSRVQPSTKRTIYSEVARLFDPLGLFAPVIVTAKLLVQQLWRTKADWDDPVDDENKQRWLILQAALPQLSLIHVPRCVTFRDAVIFELHGFADASTVAYGACIYLRSVFPDGTAKLRLLSSKSKVAPLHDLSIPRKELCAALLLTKLIEKVITALKMTFQAVVLWSDSMIVLAWLKKPLDHLQIFVRNRVAEIQTNTSQYQWHYIRSEDNPADIVSRGQLPEALSQNCLWWNRYPMSLTKTFQR